MKKMIYISADTNDADYVKTFQEISEDEVKKLLPIIKIIKQHRKHKKDLYPNLNKCCVWNTRDMDDESVEKEYEGELTEGQIEHMNEYIPAGEYGVHTIYEISIYTIYEEEDLLE